MIMRKYLFLLAFLMPLLTSCDDDKSSYMKTVTGKAGEVIVVLDKANWDGEVGTAVRDVLAKDYPMLPQREASFTLININKAAFSDLFKVHRNLLFFNIQDNVTNPGVFIKRDAWAQPQILITVEATTPERAKQLVEENSQIIFDAIVNDFLNSSHPCGVDGVVVGISHMSPYPSAGYAYRAEAL